MENIKLIDELIIGRVKPYIYAFSTEAIPGYLKVGDTYRPLSVRLDEWRQYFPDLKLEASFEATISEDVFFRDYAVHHYLEKDLKKHRLQKSDLSGLKGNPYYSKEFFGDTSLSEVRESISHIKESYNENRGQYQFYNADTALPKTYTYASQGFFTLRPNQQQVVENFKRAVSQGRRNLLMYAVMRFGKSFTALCCAKEICAKIVLVVSAKADVREEWKKTVESADNFNQNYVFLSSEELRRDPDSVTNTITRDGKGAVIFLTLQDLQGREIKEKHQQLFESPIDLLIIDETHYGARAQKYGEVIRSAGYVKDGKGKFAQEEADDFLDLDMVETQIKSLSVQIKLHLSGTPYRILMGSEFAKEDIICFCPFSDIVKEQKAWDRDNLFHDESCEEWKNPYFGFPQMVRFAFTPSKSALALLENLKNSGNTYAFSELFRPRSVSRKKDGSHRKFIHEREVLSLFEAIDGSRTDDNIFPFLDYDRIQEGKMCRHMVCVLPYRASCDALENLLRDHASGFRNLSQYQVINISGLDDSNMYDTVQSVKAAIKKCEESNQKTITLTVNRMLTGSTVEQWDTMIFLKDTASPQEYDQATFRLQNQYIRTCWDQDGREIKYNKKPQTLLVDFDPHRMFRMQENNSLLYNINTDTYGNNHLQRRIEDELSISPIITINKGKIERVEAADLLSTVSQYSSSRGIREEAQDIPVDGGLFSVRDILEEIQRQAPIGSKGGLKVEAHEGEESDWDTPDSTGQEKDDPSAPTADKEASALGPKEDEDLLSLQAKLRTYYSRILFFAFLTEDEVSSLADCLKWADTADNRRILHNLELDIHVLSLVQKRINPFTLNILDYKIQHTNKRSRDETVDPIDRAVLAMSQFGKLSESEITTPIDLAAEVIRPFGEDFFHSLARPGVRMLDIASKMGEFAIAVCQAYVSAGMEVKDIRDSLLAIPTSSVTYEFTRKVYRILGLNTDCIASCFTSYDLLKIRDSKDEIDYDRIKDLFTWGKAFKTRGKQRDNQFTAQQPAGDLPLGTWDKCSYNHGRLIAGGNKGGKNVKFNAVVGNPPYQEEDGGAGASSRPIYPDFVNIARRLTSAYASLIIPTRWYTGGKGGKDMDAFRVSMMDDAHIQELHDFLHPEDLFPDTNNRGGVCYFLWNVDYDNSAEGTKVFTHNGESVTWVKRQLRTMDLDIFIRNSSAISILSKVLNSRGISTMDRHVSSRKPFGIESNIVKKDVWHNSPDKMACPLKCLGKGMKYGYVEKELVKSGKDLIDQWKVFIPRANNVGTELNDDNVNTIVGEPGTICTEAYIVLGEGLSLDVKKAENLAAYFRTRFARFMHGLAKASHDATSKTYRFVPVQDFEESWTDEKLYEKYDLCEEEIACIESSIKPM